MDKALRRKERIGGVVVNAQVDGAIKPLAEKLCIRNIYGDDVFGLKSHRREIFLTIGAQLPAKLCVWKDISPPPGAPQRTAQRGSAGSGIPIGVSVGDNQRILMGQQELCAVSIIHHPRPRPDGYPES